MVFSVGQFVLGVINNFNCYNLDFFVVKASTSFIGEHGFFCSSLIIGGFKVMAHRSSDAGAVITERRKHWRDRRDLKDRRNPERLLHSGIDCRNDAPRRVSDIGGELAEGEVWWEAKRLKYEE